jgi:hypothetical protein
MNNDLSSSYTSLFGPMDHADGNEARSVLSPAAYLVDLLWLRDSLISQASEPLDHPETWAGIHARRPDVRSIQLNQASTFTEIPFLDIANDVMSALVPAGALASSQFPPPLPFSEQHARLKLYAGKLGTSLDEIQRLYRSGVNAHTSARLQLGLSQEEYSLFSTAHDSSSGGDPDAGIKALWGVTDVTTLNGSDVELIKKKLGLSLKELKLLVRQDLSLSELNASSDNPAASFFINQGSNYIVLDDEIALKLRLKDGSPLSNQHLDRMMRFVRLARRLELELRDLDWLLQTACGNILDEDALQAIAAALSLRKLSDELPIDELCSLWSAPKGHGQGDGNVPADLFNRAYNNDFPVSLAAAIGSVASVDALDDRLQATLRLTGADFAFLKAALLARGVTQPPLQYAAIVAYFSAFRRIVTLSTLLSLSVQEVVMLFDVLGAQWSVSAHDDLDIPMPFSAAALPRTPLALLVQPDAPPHRTLDVLQKVAIVKQWLDLRQLSPRQLAFICLEDHFDARQRLEDGSPIDDVQTDDDVEATLEDLYQSLSDTMVTPGALQTGSLTANGAQAVFDSLKEASVLVTFADPARALIRVQPSAEELDIAMQRGIHERLEIHANDFAAVKITDVEPLFSLLVSHGYAEQVQESVDGEVEAHYFVAPGLQGYFTSPNGAATFTIPNFQDLAEALFSALAAQAGAAHVDPKALTATGIDASDVPALFEVLKAHDYVEVVPGSSPIEYRVTSGARTFLEDCASLAKTVLPGFAAAFSVFSVLAARADAARVEPSTLAATGIDASMVPALFQALQLHGYVEPVSGSNPTEYRVAEAAKPLLADFAGLATFILPNFAAAFSVLAAKVEAFVRANDNRKAEANEISDRLLATSDRQTRSWMRSLSGLLGLAEDVTELAFGWAFGTPNETMTQTLATLTLPLFRARGKTPPEPALSDAYVASRFRRLQQLSLLLRKTAMSSDEARVYLKNQAVHRRLPETLKVPGGFVASGEIDALTTLPNGDFLILSRASTPDQEPPILWKHTVFSRQNYRLLGTGSLEEIPGVTLRDTPPDLFRTRVLANGIDAAFSDTGPDGKLVLHLCAGDRYVTVSEAGTSETKPITDFGKVRNNIQDTARVDAAVQAKDGRLFLFSGDQYFLYSLPQQQQLLAGPAFVDERYPKSIRGKFEQEDVSPLPALMFSRVDAAFRDVNDTYYFFAGNRYSHSTDPYNVVKIRPDWGHVLNYLFEDNRVDAAFVLGNVTYLTRRDQLTRYTGSAYKLVDEGFPISFGNIPESEPLLRLLRRFPAGLSAALAGKDGLLYAFKDGAFRSSAAPDTSLVIRDHWGRVRNVFVDNQRVDGALAYNGAVYLFCDDQYVRYSGQGYEHVDESYPRRVRPNWNVLEQIGVIPDGLPLPITAVVVGKAPGGTSDDVYFFGGNQYAGPGGALGDIKAQWARVRNNIEKSGVVDAAMLDGGGKMFLFSGDQYYRYSNPTQEFADETYPQRLSGNWAQEGNGYSLPDAFVPGISAALRTAEGNIFFFSGQSYARVDGPQAAPLPSNSQDWGVVRNWIQSNNKVSAAFVDTTGKTYLFGGDQFVRYSDATSQFADEGYPLAIRTRWTNMPESFRSDIDAALSFKSPVDNVQRLYLFKEDSYVRCSTGDLTQVDAGYPKLLKLAAQTEGLWFRGLAIHQPDNNSNHDEDLQSVEATYVDTAGGQPRIFVFYRHTGGVQWRRIFSNGNWQTPVRMDSIIDYQPFTRLDAAFVGADGTLHLFSGEQYASRPQGGGALTTPVPIRDRWARVWNQFAELGRVDACLTMGDGRTYLFCAKQYIKYTGALRPGAADFYVEESYPKRIDPNWPNEGVPVALASEFQAAGYDLCRDATGKIHFWNGTQYRSSGGGTDVLVASRWGKVENRFKDLDRVDGAYRAENGKLYLFCDTQYTRYSGALQPGSPDFYSDERYPRHVTSGWPSEGLAIAMPSTWSALGSAIFRDAEQTYVFSGSSFTSSQSSAPAPVIPQWANVRNQMQSQNRVDAGFVLGQGASAVTLLFCDDQYVRYSGAYNSVVDEGYPKIIAHLQAADGAFPAIPDQLTSELRAFFAGADGNLHVFGPQPAAEKDPQLYVSSESPSALRPLNERWGVVDNKLWDNEFVNAALLSSDGKTLFLFSGDQYVRYSGASRTNVDEGYPRRISTSYAQEIGAAALAPIMNQGVDAALTIDGTTFYFVKDQVVDTDHLTVAQPLVSRWGLVDNRLQDSKKLDAAFVAPNGKLYLFAQGQHFLYSGTGRDHVDEEYPRTIAADIGKDWPHNGTDFRSNLTATAAFEGRSYLFKGSQHVRISDLRLTNPDGGYPLENAGQVTDGHVVIDGKFVDRYDFELRTLPDWWRIKQVFDDHSSQTTTALDYLDAPPLDLVAGLARATQWPVGEINTLLSILSPQPVLPDGRAIARLSRCFELSDRMGTVPSKLKSQVWDPAFGTSQLPVAADFLYGLIKVATDPKDWPGVARSLLDPVASEKRDALVAYLVESLGKRNANHLYEHLLTDIQMDASSNTSRIVEAINSIQVYYHRALIQLEDVPEDVRENLKSWWPWMKNYRIWEANRKVFLHPENYIRPELRREKSPAFEELEQKLLQDEITAESVEEAYQRYLESFNEISRLRIVGGYRYPKKNGREGVFMIGLSRTEPPVYHYRLGEVIPKAVDPAEPIDWEPWQKLGITINADRVQPVYAFNRLFIFWIEANPFNDASFSTSGTYKADSPGVQLVKLQVKFSFYNFNKEWGAAQTVKLNPADPSDPESFAFVFTAQSAEDVYLSALNPLGDDNDDIFLKLRFVLWEWNVGRLTAGLDLTGGLSWSFSSLFFSDPKALFPTETGIELGDVTAIIPWGSHVEGDVGKWISFDAKGGTFLCRPVPVNGPSTAIPVGSVSACFRDPVSGDVFVFTGEGGTLCYYHHVFGARWDIWQGPVFATDPAWPWGRPASVFQEDATARIANVIVALDGTTYFLLGSRYFTYSGSDYSATVEHFVGDLHPGSPSLEQLVGPEAESMSWQDSLASGRSLLRAFVLPGTSAATVVTQETKVGVVTVGVDDLRDATKDQGGNSPFDGWTGLDAVFQVDSPEPRIVFSRGTQIVILTWSSKIWTTATLSLPAGVPRLSTAVSVKDGNDGKLYYFFADRYGEADRFTLACAQSLPVDRRWGRPSLFNWKLSSIDGAVVAGDGKVYLFSKEVATSPPTFQKTYCLRYTGFRASGLDSLVLDDRTQLPSLVQDVWKSDLGWVFPFNLGPAINQVTAAFARNGRVFLMGLRHDGLAFMARYTQSTQSPFTPDAGYPMLVAIAASQLSADFYAQLLGSDQKFTISRLTSHTAEQFGRRLFEGGIEELLQLDTQTKIDELPKFTVIGPGPHPPAGPNELLVNNTVDDYPGKQFPNGLDFSSPNGFYYWEIFFHIPHLIGQALRQAQRFEEAKTWYEYVFDPTHKEGSTPYWRFQEFRVDNALRKLGRQVDKYHEDPFDPHSIAELRPLAYRKAFVMAYFDNLLEWGDQLFRRYSRESIGEATMLYVLVADLLGKRPEELGKRAMHDPDTLTYANIRGRTTALLTDEILELENGVRPPSGHVTPEPIPAADDTLGNPNDSIFNPYFYIPENAQFVEFWNRAEDRLTKIRHGLDIDGVKRSLALFEPPVDVMALVKAFASGGGLAQALSDYNTPVPHYRFSFMLARARELTSRVIALSATLLSALEKKDGEELSLLRNTQEHAILDLQLRIKEQQLEGAQQSLAAFQEGLKNAQTREAHYQKLLNDGLSGFEIAQVALMTVAQVHSYMSNVFSIAAAIGKALPQIGSPFAMTYGGVQVGGMLEGNAQAWRALAEIFNFGSSLSATLGGWDRRSQEWDLQNKLATGDIAQIRRQIRGAEIQVDIARQEIQVQRRMIKNNESIDTFMRSKFTSKQLYQWMVEKLSAVYFQTYNLALQYAKAAQRAMQFELGLRESDVQYIGAGYWDSLKKGLLSGEQLQLDLDRLEKAHLEADHRRLEITRQISLAQVDPLALLHLKEKGICEFDLTEALFDSDFPGHYCRQIKSVSISLPAVLGPYESVNASLTQLAHRTLLSPNKAALKQLLQGPAPGGAPEIDAKILRADWRPNQQIAVSHGVNDSGLFQLNFQDERYLPFEGTGAVSTWRLEIGGVDGRRHRDTLTDVIMTLQYTALSGGDAFAETVKKEIGKQARDRVWLLNLAYDFSTEWQVFMNSPKDGLTFTVERSRLPGATGKKVTGVYLHYDMTEDPIDDLSRQAIDLNGNRLKPGSFKTGLSLPLIERGQDATQDKYKWRISSVSTAAAKKLTRDNLRSIALVVIYSSKLSF